MDNSSLSDDGSSDERPSTVENAEGAGNPAETPRIQKLLHDGVTRPIIGAFYSVYNKLGYGFLENVYCGALMLVLQRSGHRVAREVSVPVFFDDVQVAKYRIDFVVDHSVVVEVKSTEVLNPNNRRQLLNCLRATPLEVGLLLHFGPKPNFYRLIASQEFRRR